MSVSIRHSAVILALSPLPLLAYSDPGSGALLLQLLMAGLIGFLFQLRKVRGWLKNLLRIRQDSRR